MECERFILVDGRGWGGCLRKPFQISLGHLLAVLTANLGRQFPSALIPGASGFIRVALADVMTITSPDEACALGLESLRRAVRRDGGVPLPGNLDVYVKNKAAAIRLGKALFWDMQGGSDGVQARASCHFHAGTDNRAVNALNPDQGAFTAERLDIPGSAICWPDFQAISARRNSRPRR